MDSTLIAAAAGLIGGTDERHRRRRILRDAAGARRRRRSSGRGNATSTVGSCRARSPAPMPIATTSRGFEGVSMKAMAIISVIGGMLRAFLLIATPQRVFDAIVPFLLLFGAIVFAFGRQAGESLRKRVHISAHAVLVFQFVLGVYGGYFGGAVGIMMMATWSLLTTKSIAEMQTLPKPAQRRGECDGLHHLHRGRPRLLARCLSLLVKPSSAAISRRAGAQARSGQGADRHFRASTPALRR